MCSAPCHRHRGPNVTWALLTGPTKIFWKIVSSPERPKDAPVDSEFPALTPPCSSHLDRRDCPFGQVIPCCLLQSPSVLGPSCPPHVTALVEVPFHGGPVERSLYEAELFI